MNIINKVCLVYLQSYEGTAYIYIYRYTLTFQTIAIHMIITRHRSVFQKLEEEGRKVGEIDGGEI